MKPCEYKRMVFLRSWIPFVAVTSVTQVTAYLTKRFIRIFSLLHKKINVYLNYKNSVTSVTVIDK